MPHNTESNMGGGGGFDKTAMLKSLKTSPFQRGGRITGKIGEANYTSINALPTELSVSDAFKGLTSLTVPLCH